MIPAARLLRTLGQGAMELLFAPVCVACGEGIAPSKPTPVVCASCWQGSRSIPEPRCPRCWSPAAVLPGDEPLARCTVCPTLPPSLRAIRSAFLMTGPPREIVHALKYSGWRIAASEMAAAMAGLSLPLELEEEVRLLAPVPLSRSRMRERGYNQAALLAESLAPLKGWKAVPDLLVRSRSTESQTTLHPTERRANVAGAFSVRIPARIRREHILIVDDVWTTGATALACADALLDAGARAVSVITFGRALPELERLVAVIDQID